MSRSGPEPLLDDDTAAWIFDTYEWALRNFARRVPGGHAALALPDELCGGGLEASHESAAALLERVREHAGMTSVPCSLVALDAGPSNGAGQGEPQGPVGLMAMTQGDVRIFYNPAFLDAPDQLVATFAHELAHVLSAEARTAPPGGEACEERATDLLAVFMGFGVFLIAAALSYETRPDARGRRWTVHKHGYLSRPELAYALAIFVTLHGVDAARLAPHLGPHERTLLAAALAELGTRAQDMARLRSADPAGRETG